MSSFDADSIPEELQERDQWVCWKTQMRDGNETKVPMRPDGSGMAKSNDMATWGEFDDAAETARKNGWGIGFMFSSADPYVGVDLDGCLDAPSSPADWLPDLTRFANETFIERSPSRTGLHIILKDEQIPDWWTNQKEGEGEDEQGVEVYDDTRYFTFTGDELEISIQSINSCGLREWLRDAWDVFNDEPPQTAGGSDDYDGDSDLGIFDVISPGRYDRGERGPHPFHDSSTQANFMVDEDRETWRCWRHGVTGNAWHLLGMEQGVLDCGEWKSGEIPTSKWRRVFDRAADTYEQFDKSDGGRDRPERDLPEETPTGGDEDDDHGLTLDEIVRERVLIPLDPEAYGFEDYPGETITVDTAIDRFAAILDDQHAFLRPREDTRGWRDTLYVYADEDGTYEPHGKAFIEQKAEALLGDFATNQNVNEVVGKIERRNRVNRRRLESSPERLVVANGILDLTTGELDPHTPEEYHQTMVDVAYDREAECPAIDDFLHDVVDDSDVPTLYRLIAHCLYKEYAAEKAAMLLGDGSNGKSVFLDMVEQFLGGWNVSNQSLQKLNEDQWAANNLVGKLANVHPDMSDQTVETMQMFKKLTGRDTVSADVKFEQPVRFQNYATLIFACNRMPVLKDDTRGNWRRWILIDFPNTFKRGSEEFVEKHVLMDRLTADEELQGLLARCVEEIQTWADGREWFPAAPGWDRTRTRIRRAAEPVYDFAHACLRESDDAHVETSRVREAYNQYASEEGLPPIPKEAFGRRLTNLVDFTIENTQKRIDGSRKRVYKNVELTPRGMQLVSGDDGDRSHDSLSGPRKRADTILEIAEEATSNGHDWVTQEALTVAAGREGIDRELAEAAIERLREQGDLQPCGDGLEPV